jgi:3-phenylpropionate/trans-cinnamate dioxygenase ferredoxin subunit
MAFQRACAVSEVPSDEGIKVTLGRYDVVVARDGDDIYALQDLCSHQAVPLSEGEVADCAIECWLHGSTFDLRTGKPITLPATEPVSTFPVEVRDGEVHIDIDTTLNGVTPT